MRPARAIAGVALLATLVLLAAGDTRSQDKDKEGKEGGSAKPAAKGQLPKFWDKLGLTDAQRAEVLKVTADHKEKKDKLLEEIRRLDEDVARKRVAVLTDKQRKKLLDLEPKKGAELPKSSAKAQLPLGWDKLDLTDAQRTEILKLTTDHKEKRARLLEENRDQEVDMARKRVAVLTDEQRKKLIDLVVGEEPKDKADPKSKAKDK